MKTKSCVNNTKSIKSKRTKLVLGLLSAFFLLGLFISPAAAKTDWKISPSNPSVGDTLKVKGTASPEEKLIAEVSFVKDLPVTGGRYQYSLEKIKIPRGKDNLFTVTGEGVENLNLSVKKLIWIDLSSDASGGTATISQGHVPPLKYKIIISGDALSTPGKHSSVKLKVTASQTLKTNQKGKFNFNYPTSGLPAGKYTVKIGNSEKTIELKP
ncbi:hypothetical protein [Methanosarcina sp. UBA411]|uniref:hypothetical protein n=1 Tax=Methanosarcina sp. UBA411 TaxID=1915589 RepID=UPI0025E0EB6C|nr:hypothetical protein [Methanosarcina sp. UBA411]